MEIKAKKRKIGILIFIIIFAFLFIPIVYAECNNNGICNTNEDVTNCPSDCLENNSILKWYPNLGEEPKIRTKSIWWR